MDQEEIKKELIAEFDNIEISDRPYQVAQKAFYDRQAKAAERKIKKNKTWLILSNSVVFSVLLGFAIWMIFSNLTGRNVNFDRNTPYKVITFEQVSQYTDEQISLPLDFGEGFDLTSVKMFFPKEDEPCAIEIEYRNGEQIINVMIMIDSKYDYYDKDKYTECNLPLNRSDVDGNYSSLNDYNHYVRAYFNKSGYEYFFYGTKIEKSTLDSFIDSLN